MADEHTPAFSEQQTEALNKIINGVAANLKKQFESQLAKSGESTKGELAKLLDEKLSALRPSDEGGEGGKGGKNGKGPNPETVALQRQVTEMAEAMRASNDRASKAESRRRALERTSRLDGMLAKGGVSDPFMRELAIAHFNQRGVAPWSGDDDEAEVVWSVEDGVPITLDDGFGKWLKTDEAKRFLPAAGTKGSGSRPGQRPAAEQKKDATYEDVGNFVLGLTRGAHIGE